MAIPVPNDVNDNDNANNHTCKFVYPMDMGIKKENAIRSTYTKVEIIKINNIDHEVMVCGDCLKLHLHCSAGLVIRHEFTLKHVLYENLDYDVPRARSCNCSDNTLKPTYLRIGVTRIPLYYRYCENCKRLLKIEENDELTDISELIRPGV